MEALPSPLGVCWSPDRGKERGDKCTADLWGSGLEEANVRPLTPFGKMEATWSHLTARETGK